MLYPEKRVAGCAEHLIAIRKNLFALGGNAKTPENDINIIVRSIIFHISLAIIITLNGKF